MVHIFETYIQLPINMNERQQNAPLEADRSNFSGRLFSLSIMALLVVRGDGEGGGRSAGGGGNSKSGTWVCCSGGG